MLGTLREVQTSKKIKESSVCGFLCDWHFLACQSTEARINYEYG